MSTCTATANYKGQHIPCDWPVDAKGRHTGWAHANREYGLLWTDHSEISDIHDHPKRS